MKKVVLLAGALAAGMAAAPVTANAAAPENPGVQTYTGQTPYQEYEHYYHVLANRHTALELMKQDVQAAIDYLADSTKPAPKDDYKDMSAESLVHILADVQSQIDDLTALQFALESKYNTLNDTEKQDDTYSDTVWDTAVENAVNYVTSKVTSDQFEKLLDTYKDFDAQHKIWEEYDEWYNGTDVAVLDDGTDTGFTDKLATYQAANKYKEVDDTDDVITTVGNIQTKQTAFEGILVEPTLNGEGKIVDGIDDTLAGELDTAKNGLLADFNESTTTPGALNTLVDLYHTDQTALNSGDAAVTVGDKTVHSLDKIISGYGTGDDAVEGYDNTVDPTTGDFLTEDNLYSSYYEAEILAAQTALDTKIAAARDFIETFDAANAAAWRDNTDPHYLDGEGTNFTDEAEYKAMAVALLDEIQTLVNKYNDLLQDALDNVDAYDALREAEKVSQGKMDVVYGTETTATDDATTVIYFDRMKEDTYLDTNTDVLETQKFDHATEYVYRQLIQDLQKELCDETNDAYVTGTEDYQIHGTETTDIHDQILAHFNTPVVVDGVLEDASVYQTQQTDTNGVVFGAFNDKVAALAQQIAENEAANKALHGDDWAKAIEKHILDEMYDTCVAYDDITPADFLAGGRFWSSADCEDGKHYRGYCSTWRVLYYTFIQQEVQAFNNLKAKEYLESETGAAVAKKAVDDNVELLWNHVATVQCQTYLDRVDDKMANTTTGAFYSALALDDVCKDPASVWDWDNKAEMISCKCESNDTAENPCGWCEATAKAELSKIIDDFVEYRNLLDEEHKAGTAKSLLEADNDHNFKAYEADQDGVGGKIETWLSDFTTADNKHDERLQDLKDEATQYVHEYIHEAVGNMSHDLSNFEDGDIAAANIWAENLKNRTFPVYSSKGEAPTEEHLDLDLDGTPDTFADFEAYVDAVRDAEAIYTTEIQKLFDEHKWTELRKLTDKAKDVHPATDYMKAVEANRTAKAALLAKVEDIRSDIEEAKNEVACEDPACKTDIAAMFTELEQKLTDAETAVNNAFNAGDATTAKTDVDALAPAFGLVKKQIDDLNTQVRLSKTAALDMTRMVEKAFDKTNGTQIVEAQVEGYENFKVRNTDPEAITNEEVSYFDEIETMVQKLKDMIAKDDSHEGGHVAATSTAKYLEEMSKIQKELDKLVQAIKDNEQAHKDQLKHRDELYKKYECYDTTGLEAAVNGIADPDFSLDTEFPEVPGYPETAVDPAGKDHTKAHTAVAEAIKALDAEIKKHYENGASNVEAAKTKIGEKETAYTNAFQHAQTNDSKFMEEYGKCTEAAKAVKYTYENWKADHFANGANKYSDEANVQVTNAYNEMVAAQKAYLKDIKTDWYNNEAVEKVANNEGLLNTYKEKINAYNAAVEKAQKNDQEFDKQLAAHVVKPLTAEATYTDTRVVADPVYVTLKAQLTALYPECNNVETDSKYNTIRKQIIQDWEDEKSALNGTAAAVAAYQAAAKKYNELMANLNAYGSQLVKYLQQKDAFDSAKSTIAGYDIMTPDYKDFDGNTEGAEDYNHKKDIENAISNIDGKLNTLYGDMKTEATHVAETINDTNPANNEVNDLNVAPAVGTIKTLIENLVKDAKAWEDACDANEDAFEPLHDNIKTVEADYAEGSAKVTALPEPAQEAFIVAVKEDLEALAELQKDLEEAYMAENAVNFTKDNTDYEDLKKEIEEMYARAKEAGAHLGDIDFNGKVTVYDSDELVDIVLYNRGYAVRGDFDFNGENDVTDVERLNNLLWYEHILKAWAPGRVAFEGDIELTAEGNTVALALNNNVKTNGIQFDITVPEGAYIQNVLGTDRVEGMRVLTACIADNTYRVLVISTLNASTINDNEGNIVTFNVCGGNEVEVSNVIATDGNSHRLNGAAVSVGVTTNIEEIATEGETGIFSLDGIRQSVVKAGVNIVRGANGVAKKIFKK